ncbi:MAG: DUF4176 domain-containing protein, partial [Anaerotardibacter sp.]
MGKNKKKFNFEEEQQKASERWNNMSPEEREAQLKDIEQKTEKVTKVFRVLGIIGIVGFFVLPYMYMADSMAGNANPLMLAAIIICIPLAFLGVASLFNGRKANGKKNPTQLLVDQLRLRGGQITPDAIVYHTKGTTPSNEALLPLGSVVTTKKIAAKLMVIGYKIEDEGVIYDYALTPVCGGFIQNPNEEKVYQLFASQHDEVEINYVAPSFTAQTCLAPQTPEDRKQADEVAVSINPLSTVLPLGTVVDATINGASVRLLISTLFARVSESTPGFDYCGYPLQTGFTRGCETATFFNATDIERIACMGYVDVPVRDFCRDFPPFCAVGRIPLPLLESHKQYS